VTQPQIGFFCSRCTRYNLYSISSPLPSDAGRCLECGHVDAPDPSEALLSGGPIERCPQCGNPQLYTRKDFPQQLGCAAVSATILLSSVGYALWDVPAAVAVLALASVLDFVLYHRLGEVTVCYRCHAELRGFAPNPGHGPFDMHRAEEYEQGS
jgi:hypothetical protein